MKSHGERFERQLKNDHELQDAIKRALEEDTDSSQPMITRIGEHLKIIVEKMFDTDEDGNRMFYNWKAFAPTMVLIMY